MTTLILLGVLVVVIGFSLRLLVRASRREGAATQKAETAKKNVKSQQDMTNEVLKPRDTDKLIDKLRDDKF